MRFDLTARHAPLVPPTRLDPTDRVYDYDWDLAWVTPTRIVAAWSDDRWGLAEVYDIAITLSTCP